MIFFSAACMNIVSRNKPSRGTSYLRSALNCESWLIKPQDLTFDKVLGYGSSGTTYKGQYRGKPIAIKMYSKAILEQDIESVRREMGIMMSIKHPNLVSAVGLCITSDVENSFPCVCLVTKLASKGDLSHALNATSGFRKRLNEEMKLKVAIELAKGMEYLHGMNIVHRDLKPANVLLDDGYRPVLMDFGFSRFVDRSNYMTGETGSYRYMAPEMIRSEKYDEKVDTYSFAVLINEMFTRKRPFQNVLPVQASIGVATKGIRPSQRGIRNKRLKELISKCWSQNAEERPGWPYIVSELEDIVITMRRAKKRRAL